MSDPVTNIEIEDVLSSIRKLVSEGDRSRTRDPAPRDGAETDGESTAAEPQPAAKPDKLVLTPAFLVPDSIHQAGPPEQEDAARGEMVWEEVDDVSTSTTGEEDRFPNDPEDVTPEALAHAGADRQGTDDSGFDRSRLEASIAELEAAVSSDAQDYEPDGSEDNAEAFYWPGSMVRPLHEIEDAETADIQAEASAGQAREEGHAPADAYDPVDTKADMDEARVQPDTSGARSFGDDTAEENTAQDNAAQDNADVYADDDLDDVLFNGKHGLDEEALRKLISEIVREELMGSLGERITRNVRKLVRREIYRILSSQEFD